MKCKAKCDNTKCDKHMLELEKIATRNAVDYSKKCGKQFTNKGRKKNG